MDPQVVRGAADSEELEPEWCTRICTPEQMEYGHCVCSNQWWERQRELEEEEMNE